MNDVPYPANSVIVNIFEHIFNLFTLSYFKKMSITPLHHHEYALAYISLDLFKNLVW